MKQIRVSDQVHADLVAVAAHLTLDTKKKASLNDAIKDLLKKALEA